MELEQALALVRAAGYRTTKPKPKTDYETTNPFNHPFPHAKLKNIKLTSISRLSKYSVALSSHMTGGQL
jgi:hypothetical protein